MISAKARWELAEHSGEIPSFFMETFGLLPVIARLLLARGIRSAEEARLFLQPTVAQLHDPFLFADMERAIKRINEALVNREKICVYGDYDADGVSSTSLMVRVMQQLDAEYMYYIPHRTHEGYGLNEQAVEELADNGVTLMITVDTGISAVAQIAFAKQKGIDVIVTDHHEAPAVLPDAFAILNPKQPSCLYPYKGLAGVGVAFKLAHALLGEIPGWALQYAAIGTIADMMPLDGENRVLVKLGLRAMQEQPLPAMQVFLSDVLRKSQIRAEDIGFQLAPRINAGGRLDSSAPAVRFLLADERMAASHELAELDRLNQERRELVKTIVAQAIEVVERERMSERRVLVVADEQWNAGVIGIVASKLMETYNRSTIVMTIDRATGFAKGSARSLNGFDMIGALRSMDHLFEQYGGHQGAAGMMLHANLIDTFRERMNEFASRTQSDEQAIAVQAIDGRCQPDEFSVIMLEQLQLLEPFGPANPQPYFQMDDLRVLRVDTFGRQSEHARVVCSVTGKSVPNSELVAFYQAQLAFELAPGSRVHAVVKPSINEFRGERKPQLLLTDWRTGGLHVFDCRSLHKSGTLWSALAERLQKRARAEIAVYLGHQLDYEALCDRLKVRSLPAWTIDKQGEWTAFDAEDAAHRHQVRELWVLTMPTDPQATLTQACTCFPLLDQLRFIGAASKHPTPLRLPTFDDFRRCYRWLAASEPPLSRTDARWSEGMRLHGLNATQMRFVVDVFADLGLLEWRDGTLFTRKTEQKQSLSASPLIQNLERAELLQQQLLACTAIDLAAWAQGLYQKKQTK